MANQIEGLNGTRSTYVYENIEIVEIDGVRMVRRLKDKEIIGLNSPKKEPQEGYYQRQFNKSQPRYQDLALKEKQLKAISKWMKEHIEKTYISVNGEYKNCKFENNWLKK